MAKYIECEALLKSDNWQSLKSDFDKARAHIIILGQPAADVVEVKHGYWKVHGIAEVCSVCSADIVVEQGTAEMNYCPNCGAKMDGDTK